MVQCFGLSRYVYRFEPQPSCCRELSVVRRDKNVGFDVKRACHVKCVERAEGMRFQKQNPRGQNVRCHLANIDVFQIGYRFTLKLAVICFSKLLFPNKARQSRDQFQETNETDHERIRVKTQRRNLIRAGFGNITFSKSRGVQEYLQADLSRSRSISRLNDRPFTTSGSICLFQEGAPDLTGTISAIGRPLRKTRTVSPPSTASKYSWA